MTLHPSSEGNLTDSSRRAKLATTENGEVIGACLFLTLEELAALGVELDTVEWLTYEIDEEETRIDISGEVE